ncbi:copper-binding protein [Rubrivirga sp.]|uniref:copper-binding protein n=1 Tax=Rubrivirga sp. TaxID=1885344 RepID=UPI003B51FD3E
MRLFLLAGLAAIVACNDVPADANDPATLVVRAVYVQSMYGGEAMLVNHEAIPGRMPAMQMALRVYTPALLDSLTEGARVALTLDSASLEVVSVETLPFETVLDLDPGDGNGRGGIVLPSLDE